MTDMSLIKRLESATEGSRELDQAIYAEILERNPFYPGPALGSPYVQHYTTSLDAALTLVPEGMEISLTDLYGIPMAEVGLNVPEGSHTARLEHGTLPLALCIAALRARGVE